MLKLKKWLTFGLLATAVAVFIPACTDDDDDDGPIGYTVSISGGTMTWDDDDGVTQPLKNGDIMYAGDIIDIVANAAPAGKVFDRWTSSPSVTFGSANSEATWFRMPAGNVTVTANYKDSEPEIRFTWEAAEVGNIVMIAASENDVMQWYDEYIADYTYDDLVNLTAWPLNWGSPRLPDNLYSSTLNNATQYKGVYLPIDVGEYTAVCTIEDDYGYFDIVANYDIYVGTNDPYIYFEVAFDVGAIIDGVDSDDMYWSSIGDYGEFGWFFEYWDTKDYSPMLQKAFNNKGITVKKSNKNVLQKNGSTMELTYYVIRRPKA